MIKSTIPNRPGSALILIAMIAAIAGIFIADTMTDYAIAAAVFYTAVILAATRIMSRLAVIILAGICIALTLISFFLTPSGAYEVGLVNTGISIVAIGVTAYLGLRMVAAEAEALEARDRLLRIARVTTLGQLSSSIAHEVNQPLAAVIASGGACARWLAQDPPNIEKAQRALDRIVGDANRASEVIARIRSLSRGEAPHRQPFSLNDAVLEIVTLSRGEIDRKDITLEVDLQDDLPRVFADKVQIQQVISNLVLNAIEAMSNSARLENHLRIAASQERPEVVALTVADSGEGLTPAAQEHLFEAFWTTKEGGIGLGLTISQAIVEANAGQISAAPNSNGGTVFEVRLPVYKEGER
ncbi:MAG: two-component sensor histidine kinase [Afipia felis]|nr:two-component sensor histidine kinase [Afipia felis]